MEAQEKLRLLKSLDLLDQIPEDKLATLSDFLKPASFADGAVVFEEGSAGDGLYFISSGHIRISKKISASGAEASFKDLAILGPGDCFGEMALIERKSARSARASASGASVLFALAQKDLNRWLQSNTTLAIGFFAELVQVLSKRLRRSSNELTLLFDLSQWLLEPIETGKALLGKALGHMTPHLEGNWTAGAYLLNPFSSEMELVAAEGSYTDATQGKAPAFGQAALLWLDENTLAVSLPGKQRLEGFLVFRSTPAPSGEEKTELVRTLTTAAGLVASALENVNFRTEDSLRERLKTSSQTFGGKL